MRRIAVVVFACLLGLGCAPTEEEARWPLPRDPGPVDDGGGADDGEDVGDPDFTVTATPSTFDVPQGGETTISVKLERIDGFAESVEVKVDGLPAGVTATTLTLGADETAGSILLRAPATVAVPDEQTARVRGYATSGTRSDEVALTVRGAPGTLDTSFGSSGELRAMSTSVRDVAIDAEGRLLVVGVDVTHAVCRFEPDGKASSDFGDGGCAALADLPAESWPSDLLLLDGKIYVAGKHRGLEAGTEETFVARYHPSGVLDSSFGDAGVRRYDGGAGDEVLVQLLSAGDGGILLAIDTETLPVLLKIDAGGDLDVSFGTEGRVQVEDADYVRDVARTGSRFFVLIGYEIRALTAAGAPDESWNAVSLGFFADALTVRGETLVAAGHDFASARVSIASRTIETSPPMTAGGGAVDLLVSEAFVTGVGDDGTRITAIRRAGDTADSTFGVEGVASFGDGTATDLESLEDGRLLIAGHRGLATGVLLRVWD